jgi:hypothetical protein
MCRLLIVVALLSVLLVSVEAWGAPSLRAATRRQGEVSMKIFDWKARDAFVDYEIPAGMCAASAWLQFDIVKVQTPVCDRHANSISFHRPPSFQCFVFCLLCCLLVVM